MGVVVRSPANKKIDRADCKCFLLDHKMKDKEANFLCFRKNVVGALTNDQEKKLCTEQSFVLVGTKTPGGQMGLALDSKSEEVRNILRTVEQFTKGVHAAVKVYDESGERDIPFWRSVVKDQVLHPPAEKQKAPQTAPQTEKKTPKTPRERKPVSSGRTAPVSTQTAPEEPIPNRNVKTPEDIMRERAAWEARYMKKEPSPKKEKREDREERMLSKVELRNYRYAPDIERTFFPFRGV